MEHHNTRHVAHVGLAAVLVVLVGLGLIVLPAAQADGNAQSGRSAWRTDPAWYAGKAEWALYDAVRPIYGKPRRYEATIFTNKQQMDPRTTVKAADWRAATNIEVFKQNVSELIPTDNYAYRFLTTSFVRTDTLQPYKVVMSSQEDCGSTYKHFIVDEGRVSAGCFGYFPDEGMRSKTYRIPSNLAFHDALSLTLRDYPFDAETKPIQTLALVPDQTDTHDAEIEPSDATVRYVGAEDVKVPFGKLATHHLQVTHEQQGGATTSDYWFAADPKHRSVMVRYRGPYGVEYDLKQLDWWAYWAEPRPGGSDQ